MNIGEPKLILLSTLVIGISTWVYSYLTSLPPVEMLSRVFMQVSTGLLLVGIVFIYQKTINK